MIFKQRNKVSFVMDSLLLATPGLPLADSPKDCPSSAPNQNPCIFI